ncbi:hypothetical protein TNCT_537551 [Trichonephila clavata]|uniref:Uncharacterized protein n=1 Tax=Trichonephila clavata TaxID=2740835 RepID=A0A8X6GAM5_TRICU|nr:hypothetical protein TNCT_537551 [Trichonephila clavata]
MLTQIVNCVYVGLSNRALRRENGEEFITKMSFSIIFHRLSDFSPASFRGLEFLRLLLMHRLLGKKPWRGGGYYVPRATGESPSLEVSSDDGNNLFRRGLTNPL